MTLPVFRAVGTVKCYGGNNDTIPSPSATQVGDLLIALLGVDGPASTTWTARKPSGWTILLEDPSTDTFANQYCIMWRYAASAGAVNYAFDFGNQSGSGQIVAYSGVNGTMPFLDQQMQSNGSSSTSVAIPSVTSGAVADAILLAFYGVSQANGNPYTQPSGMTERVDFVRTTSATNFGLAELGLTGSGATGTKTATAANASKSWAAGIILNPAVPGSGDTTAPTLSSGVGTTTSSTTATIGATTNEANGTMYAIVSTSATPPSVAQIQAGQTNTGAAAPYSSSQSITTTGAKTFSATGLTASTLYYPYIQHKDAAGNDSTVLSGPSFTTSAPGDTTAPILTSPTGTPTGTTTASGTVTTDEANGTLYFLATTNSTESAATVKASGGTQTITTTGVKTVSFTGLTAATVYYAHYVHRDAAGNDSTVSNSASFTTNSNGSLAIGVLKNNTGTILASESGATVHVYALAGTLVVSKSSQTSNGSGNMTVTDALIMAGTQYRCVVILASGAEGLVKVTAT